MNATNLNQLCIDALEDLKAQDIKLLDVHELTDVTDAMIICSGTSSRHVKALSDKVLEAAKQQGFKPLGVEGETTGEWILIDLTEVVVHIFQPQVREFYDLESLWEMNAKFRNKAKS